MNEFQIFWGNLEHLKYRTYTEVKIYIIGDPFRIKIVIQQNKIFSRIKNLSFVQVRAHWNDLIFMTHIVHVNNSTPNFHISIIFLTAFIHFKTLKSATQWLRLRIHTHSTILSLDFASRTQIPYILCMRKKLLIFNSFWNNAWDLIYFHDDFVGAENSFPTHFPFPLFRNFYELNIRI